MDNLLNHCLRELGFDGDLGCSPSRLGEFVQSFYSHDTTSHSQSLDDNFMSFVWSLVVAHPNVRVGTVPLSLTSEVYVAPQTSASRKAKAKGIELAETVIPELDIIEDAKSRTLPDLVQHYGDALRIALTPDAVFAAITGSHIRSSKLSPMVYSSLQIITRGREKGVTVVELGQRSKYDQKTCFYLVKQLLDLNLIVKVRRGGVGTHFCLHRYFFDRDPSWRDIREEESKAELDPTKQEDGTEEGVSADAAAASEAAASGFTPIDARHLSSLPLVRARVVKLLKMSQNHIHQSANMLLALGFSNPNKTDRRFFQTRMRDLVNQGVIEKIVVRNPKRSTGAATTKCYRLITEDASAETDNQDMVVQSTSVDDKEDDAPGVKYNITIHKQIHDLLEEAGQTGLTMTELADSLSNFDKRTIELLLARADKNPPPEHLADIGIISLMETYGRERRHRFMTVASYRELVNKEAALDATASVYASDINLDDVGGFSQLPASAFYRTRAELKKAQDSLSEDVVFPAKGRTAKNDWSRTPTTTPRKRKRITPEEDDPVEEEIEPAPKKHHLTGSPSDQPTGEPAYPKKRGRPRKYPLPEPTSPSGTAIPATPTPKKKERLPKSKRTPTASRADEDDEDDTKAPISSRLRRTRGTNSIPPSMDSDVEEGLEAPSRPRTRSKRRPNTEVDDTERIVTQKRPKVSENEPIDSIDADMKVDQQPDGGERASTARLVPATFPVPSREMRSPQYTGAEVTEPISMTPPTPVEPERAVPALTDDPVTGEVLAPTEPMPRRAESSIPIDPALLESESATSIPSVSEQKTTKPKQRVYAKPSLSSAGRLDVSRMRRETEIYRVIEGSGGITNISTKEFLDAHVALVEQMAKAGDPTSTVPGTRLDKRTVHTALSNMENAGRVKMIRTSVTMHTGTIRPACVVYLTTVEDARVKEYMANLDKSLRAYVPEALRAIEHPVNYRTPAPKARGSLPITLSQNDRLDGESPKKRTSRAQELLQYEDRVIRDILLTERTTVGQLYGFLTAKGLRCKLFHKTATEAFLREDRSIHVASQEKRILNLSYLFNDISLKTYCALCAALSHDGQLDGLFDKEEGRNTLLKDIPQPVNIELQVGRARSRTRLLDMLLDLQSLGIARALLPSETDAEIQCTDNETHPSSYMTASAGSWSSSAPLAAPSYWQFHATAPVFIIASPSHSPPVWKKVSIESLFDIDRFWTDVESAAKHPELFSVDTLDEQTYDIPPKLLKSLRRYAAWSTEYTMTWHQQEYLRQFAVSIPQAETDLAGWDREIARLAWTSSAPPDVVASFLLKTREKLASSAEKHRRRKKKGRTDEQAKAMLAHKAAEAREHRERDWTELINKVHPGELVGVAASCVTRVKSRFLTSVSTKKGSTQWENEVRRALEEASKAEKNVLKRPSKRKTTNQGTMTRTSAIPPVPIVVNAREKSVQSLIEQQEKLIEAMPTPPEPKKRKGRRKKKEDDEEMAVEEERKPRGRRARFQWNWDFEELARDASVIIRARCRKSQKLDYSALDRVFPSLSRNTVRQRLVHIRQVPGNEAYLTRLEEKWHQIWLQYRGTPHLPDDDVNSTSNFDLATHVEFLRKHIDKNALRVGFLEHQQEETMAMPLTVDDLLTKFSVVDAAPPGCQYDFMWNATKEEGREQALLSQAFSLQMDGHLFAPEDVQSEEVGVAESALKMVMGARNDTYDAETASMLLSDVGDDLVANAARSLLSKGVLSKIVRDPTKPKPGRTLRISDQNQNTLCGSVSTDVFQDASALEGSSAQSQNEWREWPLISSEGDTAALTYLASEGKIEFQVDISHARKRRAVIDWNSKKADDDDIETVVQVMFHDMTLAEELRVESMDVSSEDQRVSSPTPVGSHKHGETLGGLPACCAQTADGAIDCNACIQTAARSYFMGLGTEAELVRQILDTVHNSGASGITKAQLLELIPMPYEQANRVIHQVASLEVPLVFFSGYRIVSIVSAAYVAAWSVVVCKQPLIRVLPRRWLDIHGNIMRDVWESALKAVIGVILFRPGSTQIELRWRLKSVLDRYEINEALRHLMENKILRRETVLPIEISLVPDDIEEKNIMWFVSGERHWYDL